MANSDINKTETSAKHPLAVTACTAVGKKVAYNPPTALRNDAAVSVFEDKNGTTAILIEYFDSKHGNSFQCGIDGENPKYYNNNRDISDNYEPDKIRKNIEVQKVVYGNYFIAAKNRLIGKIYNTITNFKPGFSPVTEKN